MPVVAFESSDLIAKLRARGISSSDLDDEFLLTLMDDGLNEYLFYKPNIAITSYATSITTVADQPNYDKPTDALWVISCGWNPDYADTEIDDIWNVLTLDHVTEHEVSVMLIDYSNMSRLHSYFAGSFEIRNDEIWLKPCPSGIYHVPVIYAAAKTLEDMDQIADNRLMELIFYRALYSVGVTKMTTGGWRAGSYQVSESVGRETMRAAEKGLERTRLLLASAGQIQRS